MITASVMKELSCDSQISFLRTAALLNPPTLFPKKSRVKTYLKNRKFRKKTTPSLASILHANPLDSCEIDKQIFIGTLGAILGLIKPLKTVSQKQSLEVFCKKGVLRNFVKFTGKHLRQSVVSAQNRRPTQMMVTTVDGTVSIT